MSKKKHWTQTPNKPPESKPQDSKPIAVREKWQPITKYIPDPNGDFLAKAVKARAGVREVWGVADLQALARDLVLWAKEDDSINFAGWLGAYSFSYDTMKYFCERSPLFREAFEIAKSYMGERRERRVLFGEHNATVGGRWLSCYVDFYKNHMEWESRLRNFDAVTGTPLKVVLESFPNSPQVPELKKDEHRNSDPVK